MVGVLDSYKIVESIQQTSELVNTCLMFIQKLV
jgi:hypothetical protein